MPNSELRRVFGVRAQEYVRMVAVETVGQLTLEVPRYSGGGHVCYRVIFVEGIGTDTCAVHEEICIYIYTHTCV